VLWKSKILITERCLLFFVTITLLIYGCTPAPRYIDEPPRQYGKRTGKKFKVGQSWTGLSSWYGPKFHGRRTANGEVYDMNGMTAAHKELPFNTIIEVTHLGTGKSCRVRINDRGPFKGKRILDLSKGAAQKIGLIRDGVAEVRIRIVKLGDG